MAKTREYRRKIKSVKNIRQITKAMELVAASKMKRAVDMTLALRPYATLAHRMLRSLGVAAQETLHALLKRRPVQSVLVVLFSTDRGLCGGLNAQLFRAVTQYLAVEKGKADAPKLQFVVVGKKGMDFLRRMQQTVIASFSSLSAHPTFRDVLPISRLVLEEYTTERYDKVMLCYSDFHSAMRQEVVIRRLLPLSRAALSDMLESLGTSVQRNIVTAEDVPAVREYVFEPGASAVLSYLLPRLTEMQIYQAVLEQTASEHSARMFAMRSASDNAGELISDLTLAYNGIRQSAITAELAEISAGMAAMG